MSMIIQHVCFPEEAELDMNAAAGTKFAWKPVDEYTVVDISFLYVEAVAAGGFSTTKAVVAVDHSVQGATAVEKAVYTLSAADAAAGIAIGTEKAPDSDVVPFTVRPGDTVNFDVNTQGAGGTVTGQLAVQLLCRINPVT